MIIDRTGVIERVEVIPIRVPCRRPVVMSTFSIEAQENLIVRVWSGGKCGIGEAEPFVGFSGCVETQASVRATITDRLAPAALGCRARDGAALAAAFEAAAPNEPYATSAMVNAVFDLNARLLGIPLHVMLGGAVRNRLPIVATIGIGDKPFMAQEATAAANRGFRYLKLKIGAGDPERELSRVAAVRAAVGPRVGLRVDANAGLGVDEALIIAGGLRRFGCDLMEQPLARDDLSGAARLVAEGLVPIMPDESLTSPASALALVAARAADIFGMKIAKHGGLHGARKVAAIGEAAGLPIYPGNQPSTSVGSATAAHFFAAQANARLAGDFNVGPTGWLADDIVIAPLAVTDGMALLPEGPGVGVEIDERKLDRYAVA